MFEDEYFVKCQTTRRVDVDSSMRERGMRGTRGKAHKTVNKDISTLLTSKMCFARLSYGV